MKITLSKSQWQLIGQKAGWIKTAKIGKDDVALILDRVKEIWQIMDRLQGMYKFAPERNKLREFQMGMEKVLPYAEAKSNKSIRVASGYEKYLSFTPADVPGLQYYVLNIPVGVIPPNRGDHLELKGNKVVVASVNTPEDIAKGRGGPVAKSMKENEIAYSVNCLPEGHEWLKNIENAKSVDKIEYAIIDSTGFIFKRSIRDTEAQVKEQALYTTGHN